MSKKRILQAILVLASSPFLCYSFSYVLRFVLTGYYVEGGGDRAMLGLFVGIILLAPVFISEIDIY